jgi:peptidoglycan biosynthesis protein MviN/MurJ (putative lipid II flippase)
MTPIDETGVGAIAGRVIRGMFVIIFFYLFLKLGGFLMYLLVEAYFGTGPLLDAFTAVYGLIIFLVFYSSLLKIVQPVFMPLFAERRQQSDEAGAWDIANTTLNLVLIAGVASAVGAIAFAPKIIDILLPRLTPEAKAAATIMLRWMAPGLPLMFFAVMGQGILNSYKSFSYPAAGEAAQKLFWAAGILAGMTLLGLSKRLHEAGPHLIGAAFLIGCAAQAGILIVGMRGKLRHYRPRLPLLTSRRTAVEAAWIALFVLPLAALLPILRRLAPAGDRSFLAINAVVGVGCLYAALLYFRCRERRGIMDRIAYLAAPLLVGVLFARYRDLAFGVFQSYTEEGQFGVIELAKKVANLPNLLVAYSLTIAMFPFLCDLAAKRDIRQLGEVVGGSLRMLAVLLLPLTAVTVVMSVPVMRLLFDHGDWGPQEARMAGLALALLSTGIYFMAIEGILMQTFFSLQRTLLPTILGIIFSILPSVALYVVIEKLGHAEYAFVLVCAAWPAARGMKNLLLFAFAQTRTPLIEWRSILPFAVKLAALCLGCAAAAWAARDGLAGIRLPASLGEGRMALKLTQLVRVVLPSTSSALAFVFLCWALRLEESRAAVRWVRQRGWRRKPSSTQEAEDR